LLVGCAVQKQNCPPLTTPDEATAALREYFAGLEPLKATGNCTLSYVNEKGEKFAQSFPIRIWYQNNRKFCLYGDLAFDPKAVGFILNGDEYWTYAKPFEMYTSGKIGTKADDYFSTPLILIDFLKPLNNGCENLYMADIEKNCNILVCKYSDDCKAKKIFIDRCKNLVKKIEFLNCSGKTEVIIESDEYKNVARANFSFPRKLVYKRFDSAKGADLMRIKLDSVKSWQPSPAQLKMLFSPPDVNIIQKETKR
jgi:hypothetical protein